MSLGASEQTDRPGCAYAGRRVRAACPSYARCTRRCRDTRQRYAQCTCLRYAHASARARRLGRVWSQPSYLSPEAK